MLLPIMMTMTPKEDNDDCDDVIRPTTIFVKNFAIIHLHRRDFKCDSQPISWRHASEIQNKEIPKMTW